MNADIKILEEQDAEALRYLINKCQNLQDGLNIEKLDLKLIPNFKQYLKKTLKKFEYYSSLKQVLFRQFARKYFNSNETNFYYYDTFLSEKEI